MSPFSPSKHHENLPNCVQLVHPISTNPVFRYINLMYSLEAAVLKNVAFTVFEAILQSYPPPLRSVLSSSLKNSIAWDCASLRNSFRSLTVDSASSLDFSAQSFSASVIYAGFSFFTVASVLAIILTFLLRNLDYK